MQTIIDFTMETIQLLTYISSSGWALPFTAFCCCLILSIGYFVKSRLEKVNTIR